MAGNNGFTDKQKAFIDWYVILLNGTESARRAKYKGNDNTLAAVASENLRKPKLRAEIDRRLRESAISAEETLARVKKHATGSLGDFLDDDERVDLKRAKESGKLDLLKKYKETETKVVNKFGREVITTKREIEIYPSDAALDKLMRYHGMYKDNLNIDIDVSGLSDDELNALADNL